MQLVYTTEGTNYSPTTNVELAFEPSTREVALWSQADDLWPYSVSDDDARRWAADGEKRRRAERRQALRERVGATNCAVTVPCGSGIAGSWADADESRIGADDPVSAVAHLDVIERPYVAPGEGFPEDDWTSVPVEDGDSWLEDQRTLAQDRAMLSFLLRDERELARESRERRMTAADNWLATAGDAVTKPRVTGDYWGAGAAAEKAWLDAQIAQLRIEYREVLMGRCRELTRDRVSCPVAMRAGLVARASRIAQLAAIKRQAGSLRHRHNFKRYVEALKCDPELAGRDFVPALASAQAWRKRERLAYDAAVVALAGMVKRRNEEALMGERHWTAVDGLIAA